MSLLRAKCLFVGDPCVGKSSIFQVFQSDDANFPKAYNMTLGVDLGLKTLKLLDSDVSLEFHLVEVSGNEPYTDFLTAVVDSISMVLVVFDVTNETSFKAAEGWIKKVRDLGAKTKLGALIANKIDLEQRRVVDAEAGAALAKSMGLKYVEMSAKSGQGLSELFQNLASEYLAMYKSKMVVFQNLAV